MKKILILIFAGTILFNASDFIHPLDFKNSIVEKQKVMEFIVNDVKEIYTKCCLNLGIKQSVDVNVVAVNTIRYKGKTKTQFTRKGRFTGKTPRFKKAIVTIKEGQTLDLFEEVSTSI